MPYPLIGFGYEEVGEVIEVAPEVVDRQPGQLVWGIWGHRAEAVLAAEAVRPLPRVSTRSPRSSPAPAPSR
ncbi:hypothetical protein NKG94_13890 [Micromonospora sp. M12]